jgi:hypothetical protein
MTMDMTNFPDMDEDSDDDEDENPCDDMETGDSPLTNIKCTYKDKVVTLTGKLDRRATGALKITGKKYRLDVWEAIYDFNSDDEDKDRMSLPEDKKQMAQLKSYGVVYEYTVKMPGKVKSQKGGVLQDDGTVKFDILTMPEGAYVESETGGLLSMCPCMPFMTLILAGLAALAAKLV